MLLALRSKLFGLVFHLGIPREFMNILHQEIIQNADDAGARKISFLLDTRENGKSSLYHPEYRPEPAPGLCDFQGPALYAHNDAKFTEDDWDNLMNLMRSNKKDDPLKVGRFGIGFNSVYHITGMFQVLGGMFTLHNVSMYARKLYGFPWSSTSLSEVLFPNSFPDLPGIVSGDTLAFLDPHEAYFERNESGQKFDLKEPLLEEFYDQFSPFEDVLGCKISAGCFEGTLFRFPLRNQPSKLSSKPYSAEKVSNLFKSLRQEAPLILLFLKNVEEICLYETNEHSKEKLLFSVKLDKSCRRQIREEKGNFLKKLTRLEPTIGKIELCQKVTIKERDQRSRVIASHDWLTYNCVDPTDRRIYELSKKLGLLPWVGFATPLTRAHQDACSSTKGRIFCFLPLPPDADAKTGLPVHIHGYFGLSDNRRGLKWPGPDCQNDDTAEWNELLLKRVGSYAYAALLEVLSQKVTADVGYQSWPWIEKVEAHWKCILEPMITILVEKRIFWTEAGGGRWIRAGECLLNRMEFETPPVSSLLVATVLQTLVQANENVVTLPSHMNAVIALLSKRVGIQTVTPAVVRNLLRKGAKGSWTLANMSKEEKLKLLDYILIDNQRHDLEGISLLPKADGSFVKFRRPDAESFRVYVPTSEQHRALLPNFDRSLLDSNVQPATYQKLVSLANDSWNSFQLTVLNQSHLQKLLWKVIPEEWVRGGNTLAWYPGRKSHPPKSWLKHLWQWLKHQSLASFEAYPLIPHSSKGNDFILKLRKHSSVIMKQWSYLSLPDSVAAVLRKCQCVVLESVPEYVLTHGSIQEYVSIPTPDGVLGVLLDLPRAECTQRISQCSPKEKRALRGYLAGVQASLTQGQRELLLQLPIFEGIDGKSFLPLQGRSIAPRQFQFPSSLGIPGASGVVSTDDDASYNIISRLGMTIPTPAGFLISAVLPGISSGFYNYSQVPVLTLWILDRIATFRYQDYSFENHLKSLRCIPLENGCLVKPDECFDPQEALLEDLFKGDTGKFPRKDFRKETSLHVLRSLGMKRVPKPEDLLNIARCLRNVAYNVAVQRGNALLKFLTNHPEKLQERVPMRQSLASILKDLPWVPCQRTRPATYPSGMPWKSEAGLLCTPSQIRSFDHANLVGASEPIAPKTGSAAVDRAFDWNREPPVSSVIQQLSTACTVVRTQCMKSRTMEHFRNMLHEIYRFLSDNNVLLCHFDEHDIIWHGSGFASPSRMALRSDYPRDLRPHLYTVPDDFKEYRNLFLEFGVRATFQESDLLGVLRMIKEEHGTTKKSSAAVSRDLQLCIDILHWTVKDQKPVDQCLCNDILVPAVTYDKTLKLVPCNEAHYYDTEWLRRGGSELQITSDFTIIHQRISPTTALLLHVTPLSTSLASAEPLGFEETGPHEPITTRLKNILGEYKEGAGVLKELVQNADDAGATEVKILVDWREHKTERLLSPGMAACQGPALLAYSNSVFTDGDLQNISKVAGATKKEDMEKIGRFGLGFSSVYHFTDVPSFVTRQFALFFDPHTTHLGAHIRNSSRPGIKLDLGVNSDPLRAFSDQFKPYHDIFGCNTSGKDGQFYLDGTLFRFPFRKSVGEISDKTYNRRDVEKLLAAFKEISSSLLLFVQNVKNVTIYEVSESSPDPSNPRVLLSVSKAKKPAFPGNKKNPAKSPFLKECAEWIKSKNLRTWPTFEAPKRSEIVSIKRTSYEADGRVDQESKKWLICSCLGQGEALELGLSKEGREQGLLPCASVAAMLPASEWQRTEGEAFCFLPLSIPTGLPVHVNGYFAVTSNRRGVWEATKTESSRTGVPLEARWNKALMEDALAEAYHKLLVALSSMKENNKVPSYQFSALWPQINMMHSKTWSPLITSVYRKIATSAAPLVECGPQWLRLDECLFPDERLRNLPGSLKILLEFNFKIGNLPPFASKGFEEAGCQAIIEARQMTKEAFLAEEFFPRIAKIDGSSRDAIICHLLDELLLSKDTRMTNTQERCMALLRSSRCIPCQEAPGNLAKPGNLVDPTGKAAPLFSGTDGRFPVGDCYRTEGRRLALQKLGMVKDRLDWTAISERAKSVKCLKHQDKRRQRVQYLIKYLNDESKALGTAPDLARSAICSAQIFPVLPKPPQYPLPWKGSAGRPGGLLSAEELYSGEHTFLVGASRAIIDESERSGCGRMSGSTKALLGLSSKRPDTDDVLEQLKHCAQFDLTSRSASVTHLQDTLRQIYDYLSSLEEVPAELREESFPPWMWHGSGFARPSQMAFASVGKLDLRPHLFVVRREFGKYRDFFEDVGIKSTFEEQHLLDVLHQVKQKHETTPHHEDGVQHDLKLVSDILHWLVRDGRLITEELQDQVLVPVVSYDRSLKLVPSSEASYCDAAWLRKGGSEFSVAQDLPLIHERFSSTTARRLRVPPVSTRLTSAEAFGFEQTGPHEPITTRLKNILDEYKEGAGVLKELVQNADDAGATKVNVVVDWRNHASEKLLAPGMAECQGPALLAHSDSIFTENDMANISKVAGATKREDTEKIGRFGLGFSSVYHFTDVPSFITRNYAVFFDPCLSHLGDQIYDKSRPGIKLNLEENSRPLAAFPDQFAPFDGIFGCQTGAPGGKSPFHFNGTLFRFPLRKKPGEISSKVYKKADVQELLASFKSVLSTLLLFVQNVCEVTVSEMHPGTKSQTPTTLFSVKRQELSSPLPTASCRFLKDCARWTKQIQESDLTAEERDPPPRQSDIVSITCRSFTGRGSEQSEESTVWCVRSCVGEGESLTISRSDKGREHGLLSCAGVAALIRKAIPNQDGPHEGFDKVRGEAFSFLPLSFLTGLPVHVNGYFAVTSNRRGLWEATTEERKANAIPLEARWNETLMDDALAQAYLTLLQDVVTLIQRGVLQSHDVFRLWPDPRALRSTNWLPLLKSVYRQIASSSFPFVCSGSDWLPVQECIYPDAGLQAIPGSINILRALGFNIVDLPQFATLGFQQAGCDSFIKERCMTHDKFLSDVFFPRIQEIRPELRDPVVCYVLDECLLSRTQEQQRKKELYTNLLQGYQCVPCSPHSLAYPKDLISPYGAAAALFKPEDLRFPMGECYRTKERLMMLEKVGMAKDVLSWNTVHERAKTVSHLSDRSAAKELALSILKYLEKRLVDLEPVPLDVRAELCNQRLFPVRAKPKDYRLAWQGDDYESCSLLSADDVYEGKHTFLVGSCKAILDESEKSGCGALGQGVRDLFGLSSRSPSASEVLQQLEEAITHAQVQMCPASSVCISTVATAVYGHLQTLLCQDEQPYILERLSTMRWIFVGDKFCDSSEVAFDWKGDGSPYLYRVPKSLKDKFPTILQAAGVGTKFRPEKFVEVLFKMEAEKDGKSLTGSELRVVRCFLEELYGKNIAAVQKGCVPMPDSENVLRPAKDLAIDDAPWMRTRNDIKCVSTLVPPLLAHRFGSRDIRTVSLEDVSRPIGESFGQSEKLTDRLKGILKNYPCDMGILKELVQNADDARATKVHFIFDSRTHSGERVLSDEWKELQGPALCIFNDQPFSEGDLEGIQRLGIGSKADDPQKTGQYGIGFNSVYHLTDCPSFLSDGDTLCILDPHARYAPGATREKPGRLIKVDERIREDYKDVFAGYLEDEFNLSGCTMFRLPLRRSDTESLISDQIVDIRQLMNTFRFEAREILLFLNHVKEICLSEIDGEGNLKRIYQVSAELTETGQEHRAALSDHIRKFKTLETAEIPWHGVTYPMTIRDSVMEEDWLVHQSLGLKVLPADKEVPNGKARGLLPRAGVAAKISTLPKACPSGLRPRDERRRFRAFCFLPLPVTTGLPVHVNGHFCLDSGRRNLWRDDSDQGFGTRWNTFMKSHVLAQAYTSLILEARSFIPGVTFAQGEKAGFSKKKFLMYQGMSWYHELFPQSYDTGTDWEPLARAVYLQLATDDEEVLPFVRKVKRTDGQDSCASVRYNCEWLKLSQGFFHDFNASDELHDLVLDVGVPLLCSPMRMLNAFKEIAATTRQLNPDELLKFLKGPLAEIGHLPRSVSETPIASAKGVLLLLEYCMKSPAFAQDLSMVPLLLTEDNCLRRFEDGTSVFLSRFSDLVPTSPERFLQKTLATALLRHEDKLFSDNNVRVVMRFDIPALVEFLPGLFPEILLVSEDFVPWKKLQNANFEKWLKRLWQFLSTHRPQTGEDAKILDPLLDWPVIPTRSDTLAPVALARVVLDLTHSDSWSSAQETIVEILRKLKCPEADMDFMESGGSRDISPVLKPYLAHPNSSQDVLRVLDHLVRRDSIEGLLTQYEMLTVLRFFQDDAHVLKQRPECRSMIMKLPFFKSLSGAYVSLDCFVHSIYVVPDGLPLEESHVWMGGNHAVFLAPCQELRLLYREVLGVDDRSHVECYMQFIFPKFSKLQAPTRLKLLEFLKDSLLNGAAEAEQMKLKMALRSLAFIPDSSGRLHTASHFFDPNNEVFKAMLTKGDLPPKPFGSGKWLRFLREIGLKTDVTQEQFLEFAKKIGSEGYSGDAQMTKSKVLVEYLFKEEKLQESAFLRKLATVKFIPSLSVNSSLARLHSPYPSSEVQSQRPLIAFKGAVAWQNEKLVWTSAPLLEYWATPTDETLCEQLGVLQTPALEEVLSHIKNLAKSLSGNTDRESSEARRALLKTVMNAIYSFLKYSSKCPPNDSLDNCTAVCRKMGERLTEVPCILVEDGRVFVQGDQLAFVMREELPPYLYRVPREHGQLEHLFKRLGAAEEASPLQYAKMLGRLKGKSKDEKMHAEELNKAKSAVHGLFLTLDEGKESSGRKKLPETSPEQVLPLAALYLPSQAEKLRKSSDLILDDCPEFSTNMKRKRADDMLYDLRKCDLKFARPEDMMTLLPESLRPKTLRSLVREEIRPDCVGSQCETHGEGCVEVNRLLRILFSQELASGIKRLLKHERRSATLSEDVLAKVDSFQATLSIACMKVLGTQVVFTESGEVFPGRWPDVFCSSTPSGTSVYIKHDADPQIVNIDICRAINGLIGVSIGEQTCLQLMISSKCPSEISAQLDRRGVAKDMEAAEDTPEEQELGSEIPPELHYLLAEFDDFLFREGEMVGYEQEPGTADRDPKYVHARIIRKVHSAASKAKPKKDRTKRKQRGESKFLARYLIDIGSEKLEVDVLDLYKWKRPHEVTEEEPEEPYPETTDIVPFEGDTSSPPAGASAAPPPPPKPTNLEEAKKEVRKALNEIWKLPEDKRKKAIRRLYLRWHPDKNIGQGEPLANEVMKFIQQEIDRLERRGAVSTTESDFDFDFRGWNRRARRQRSSYHNFHRSNPGFPGFYRDSYRSNRSWANASRDYRAPDSRMARLWMKQYQEDLRAVVHLLSAREPFYYLVCSLCHEVVEKALKAALYSSSGISSTQLASHDIVRLAADVSSLPGAPRGLTGLATKISNYYEPTRYPHKHQPPRAPADVYTDREAQEAWQVAKDAAALLENFMGFWSLLWNCTLPSSGQGSIDPYRMDGVDLDDPNLVFIKTGALDIFFVHV